MQYFFFDTNGSLSKYQDWEFADDSPNKIEDQVGRFESITAWLETTGSEFSMEYRSVERANLVNGHHTFNYLEMKYMVAIAVDERDAMLFKLRWC